jgi:ankyrin repeat protein
MGHNCLFIACINGSLEGVKLLSKHSPNVNIQDKNGWTPLMVAVFKDYVDVVDYLLINLKADVTLCDVGGKRAIDKTKNAKVRCLLKLSSLQ